MQGKTPKNKKYASRVLAQIYGQPWAITKVGMLALHQIALRQGSIEALLAKRGEILPETNRVEMRGSVAIIPACGPIIRYSNIFTMISGATSVQILAEDLQMAMDDPKIKTIIMNYDGPGGQVAGINELANRLHAARKSKEIISYCSGVAASAHYWLAATGSEVICDATCQLGSIGTVIGFKKGDNDTLEIVSSQSPNKRLNPETSKGQAQALTIADAITDVFIRSVARFRGTTYDKVLNDFGQGSVLVGEHAVTAGLADRLGSLEEIIESSQANTNTQTRGFNMKNKADQGGDQAQAPAITMEMIKNDHPTIATSLIQEGAAAELARVKGVFALSFPGHDDTIAKMALDGETTAESAALKLVNLEQEKRQKIQADRKEDGDNMKKVPPGTGDDDTDAAEEASLIAAAADAGSSY